MPNEASVIQPNSNRNLIPAQPFFTVSLTKFIFLTVTTLNFYPLYWFYRNWQIICQQTGENLSPGWRAIFAPFTSYAFFARIEKSANEIGVEHNLYAIPLFLGYAATQFGALFDIRLMPLGLISGLFFIPANQAMLRINQALYPSFRNYGRITIANWAGAIAGSFFILLFLLGLMAASSSAIPIDQLMNNGMAIF